MKSRTAHLRTAIHSVQTWLLQRDARLDHADSTVCNHRANYSIDCEDRRQPSRNSTHFWFDGTSGDELFLLVHRKWAACMAPRCNWYHSNLYIRTIVAVRARRLFCLTTRCYPHCPGKSAAISKIGWLATSVSGSQCTRVRSLVPGRLKLTNDAVQ